MTDAAGASGTHGHQLIRAAAERLRAGGVESPDHDARTLLAHVLDVHPAVVSASSVPAAAATAYEELIERRAAREPLQHLTGRAWFRYVELAVGPGVFVPRPETEVMTGWVIEKLRERPAGRRRVVDLCTGSGAVAKAIADEVPDAEVHAIELSEDAVAWAGRNLSGTGVDLRSGDMAGAFPELDGLVDAVIANPPYIPLEAYASVAPEARDHDPTVALFSGEDGLDAIRTLVGVAARLLVPGGVLAYEHAEVQAASAPQVAVACGAYDQVRDHPDLLGRPRFVTALRGRAPAANASSGRDDLAGWAG